MHLAVFYQWRHTSTVFSERLNEGPESLLLVGSIVILRISNAYEVVDMLPICLAFSFLWHCPYLPVVGYILNTVRGSLFIEEFVSFSLQHLHMFIYPWLMGLASLN